MPVLLSVGYAACHWCHVMAHESFEDDATAAYLNEHFVSIKVDREERPDVDAVYMDATTAMTGHGGWPMTCVLDHDGNPFFAGTYFPDQPRHGQPAFRQVLEALADAWQNRGDDVRRVTGNLRDHLRRQASLPSGSLDREVLDGAVALLEKEYDAERGGFGGAPKFPPSMVLEFLLRHGSERAMAMAAGTLEAMARGGIHDQLGGGFARYSVDADWVVPHFEKMLYDNAQLLRVYAEWSTDVGVWAAEGIADFLLGELRTPEGGFASALDADSEGAEGTFYVWTPQQLVEVLGPDDGPWAARLLSVTDAGTFEHGTSTLQLREDPDDLERWFDCQRRLREAREHRERPARDDKVVAAWNGLAISGLCVAGTRLGRSSGSRRTSTPPSRPGSCCCGLTSSTVDCAGSPGTASWALRPGCWRTTAVSRPASSTSSRPPATPAGSARPVTSSTSPSTTSEPTTAASTTPRTTPRPWWPGPATRPTTPARPDCPRRSTRWRRTPPSPAPGGTGRQRRRRWRRRGRSPSGLPDSRAGPSPRPRPCSTDRSRSRSWAGPARTAAPSRTGPAGCRVRWSSSATGRATTSRC